MDIILLSEHLPYQRVDTILVKIPENVYQCWYNLQYQWAHETMEFRQKLTFDLLQKWVSEKYPAYGLVAFEDYSTPAAEAVARKTGLPITWGMYVLLQIGGSMQPISITDKLLEGGV